VSDAKGRSTTARTSTNGGDGEEGAMGVSRPRGRERKEDRRRRAQAVFDRLREEYPDAHCALDHRDAYELTVATILSAQCTDARVNMVTPELFRRWPDAAALADADLADVEEVIRSTGFFRSKAGNLVGMAQGVVEDHGGEIPQTMEELSALPGIGRKTANVVLGNAFGIDEGIVVDTHVRRLSNRLRFTRQEDPVKIEKDLVKIFPRDRWTLLSHLLIFHGRAVCTARKPRCEACVVSRLCPSSTV
jgi:endonuclease III